MPYSKLILVLSIFFNFPLISSSIISEYNMTLGQDIYISDVRKNNILRFYLPTNYLQAFRIQFDARIVSAERSPIETDTILIQEMDEKNRTVYHKEIQQLNSENSLVKYSYYIGRTEISDIYFTYYIKNINTKLLLFEFDTNIFFRNYIYINAFLPEKYELYPNIDYNFTNITIYNPYTFFLKYINKSQIINLTITTNDNSKDDIFIQEYDELNIIERNKIFYELDKKTYLDNELYSANYLYAKQSSKEIGLLYFNYKIYKMNHFFNIKYNIIGEQYFFEGYNDTIKIIKNIEQNYLLYFWIKATKMQKLYINLKYTNSLEGENLIEYIDIYERECPNISHYYITHTNLKITPDENKNNEIFKNIQYEVNSYNTNYILLKINPEKYIKNFEIQVNMDIHIYEFDNDKTKNNEKYLTYITANTPIYFFIKAIRYNKIFINLTFNNKYIEPFNYINISEYENRNDISYIKSNLIEYEIKNINKDESNIELNYTPESSKSKLIFLKFESNINMDYLKAKLEIGGGYYEINNNINNINIDNIIAKGSTYYFSILAPIFKKIDMNIIINDDNIKKENDINPFTYANIYEKEKRNEISYNKFINQTFIRKIQNSILNEYFTYIVDSFNTKYLLIELKPNIDIENIFISIHITNSLYDLSNGGNINITDIFPGMPYYFKINCEQFQQININLKMNYLQENPDNLIQIYELKSIQELNEYNAYTNTSIKFIDNKYESLFGLLTYSINSIYTSVILVKIILKKNYIEYLNTEIDIGGGYYEIEKGLIKNVTANLFPKYSYYFFIIASKGEKLNIKLILNDQDKEKPFSNINIYEYSNKNAISFYLYNVNKEIKTEIKDNKSTNYFSYIPNNNSTNYIALEIKPNHNISSFEYLVELESKKEKENNYKSLINILIIILVIVILFTTVIFALYIRKFCIKSSSITIEEISIDKILENKNEEKDLDLI